MPRVSTCWMIWGSPLARSIANTASVLEPLHGPRLLGLPAGRVMAAGHEDDLLVVEADPHLVPIDAGVDRLGLRDLHARRHVGVDAIDLQPARIAERDKDVLRG